MKLGSVIFNDYNTADRNDDYDSFFFLSKKTYEDDIYSEKINTNVY